MQEYLIVILLWMNTIINLLLLFIIGVCLLIAYKSVYKKLNKNPKNTRGIL